MKNKSYVVWNNKGGVGKSTITFQMASVYAIKNPDKDVVVIDMCPQANCSMMLLGGGNTGEENLRSLISQKTPKSVVGYISEFFTEDKQKSISEYVVKVSEKNKMQPENIYLLSGDGNLELIAPFISKRAEIDPISEKDEPWKKIHLIMKKCTEQSINQGRESVFFLDTNPSFSVYTQMAILAGDYLLVPINADDSSIFAISGLFDLVFGFSGEHPVYGKYTFARRVKDNKMNAPKIYLLLGNRFTQKVGAAHAFKALSKEATRKMYEVYKSNPVWFRDPSIKINDRDGFEKEFSIELRDFNSAGVISSNKGIPLIKMTAVHEVYGEDIQVSKEQREKCSRVIEEIVSRL